MNSFNSIENVAKMSKIFVRPIFPYCFKKCLCHEKKMQFSANCIIVNIYERFNSTEILAEMSHNFNVCFGSFKRTFFSPHFYP